LTNIHNYFARSVPRGCKYAVRRQPGAVVNTLVSINAVALHWSW